MNRSAPLRRKHPMKRSYRPLSAMSAKARAARKVERRWKDEHPYCWICGSAWRDLAHLVAGRGRLPDPRLFAALCRRDHDVFDGRRNDMPKITKGMILKLKWVNDRKNYSRMAVSEALGYRNGYLKPEWNFAAIPQFYLDERARNAG